MSSMVFSRQKKPALRGLDENFGLLVLRKMLPSDLSVIGDLAMPKLALPVAPEQRVDHVLGDCPAAFLLATSVSPAADRLVNVAPQ